MTPIAANHCHLAFNRTIAFTRERKNCSRWSQFYESSKQLEKINISSRTDQPAQVNPSVLTAINGMTERIENLINELQKPIKTEHRHMIDIASSKSFLTLVILSLAVLGLSYIIKEQRNTIGQYQSNDLKYRYIKMQGKADGESLYMLERQFEYTDSATLVRQQVEEYERLVRELAEQMERARWDDAKVDNLRRKVEEVKGK
ncbi:hypothetical protein [Viscerimonas tarda]